MLEPTYGQDVFVGINESKRIFKVFFLFVESFALQPLAPPAGDLGQCHPLVETGFYSVVKWP